MWETLVQIDQSLLKYINSSFLSKYPSFWSLVTQLEFWLPLYIFFFFIFYKKLKKPAHYIAMMGIIITSASALGITRIVKNTVQRVRPNNDPLLMDHIQIIHDAHSYSFWSGHTAVSVTVTFFVYFVLQRDHPSRMWLLFFIWPLLFSISRLYVGVHYPLDVMVGALAGLFLATIYYKMFSKLLQRLEHTT